MAATLSDIESALLTALGGLRPTPPVVPTETQPFRHVGRWAGEVSRDEGVEESTLNAAPAALLAFERSEPEGRDGGGVETGSHLIQVVERHFFLVYVVVSDQRSDTITIKGTNVVPGILQCAQRVKEALAGLIISGLFDGDVVRLEGHAPWLIERGVQHTHLIRVSARSALPESADATPNNPFGVEARVGAEPPEQAATLAAVRVAPT